MERCSPLSDLSLMYLEIHSLGLGLGSVGVDHEVLKPLALLKE